MKDCDQWLPTTERIVFHIGKMTISKNLIDVGTDRIPALMMMMIRAL